MPGLNPRIAALRREASEQLARENAARESEQALNQLRRDVRSDGADAQDAIEAAESSVRTAQLAARAARREYRAKSLERLSQTQQTATRGIYSITGLSIVLCSISTTWGMRNFLPSSATASVLLLISFVVGLLTFIYGVYLARVMEDSAQHDIALIRTEDDDSDESRRLGPRHADRRTYVGTTGDGRRRVIKRSKSGQLVIGTGAHSTRVRGL